MIKNLKANDRTCPLIDLVKRRVIEEILVTSSPTPMPTSPNVSSIHRTKTFNEQNNKTKSLTSSTLNSFFAPEKKEASSILKCNTMKYDITFNEKSKKKVILESEDSTVPYEINTFCKEDHEQIKKSKRKGDIEGVVKTLNKKITITNDIINEHKEKNELTSDENLALAFSQDKLHHENLLIAKQIERIKEDIRKMRSQLIDNTTETQRFGLFAVQYSKETELLKEELKRMQKLTEQHFKEKAALKQSLASLKFDIANLKKNVYPNSEKSSKFIKDITKLIPAK